MRKLFNSLLSLVVAVSAGVVFATSPPEEVPVQNTENPPIESIVSDSPAITEVETVQIKTEPMSAKIDEASDIKPYDINNLPKERLPEPKSEIHKLALMFLQVMIGVIVSIAVVYILALGAKKKIKTT